MKTIAASSQNTAENSQEIVGAVEQVLSVVERVHTMALENEDMASDLNIVVGKFKVEE